MSCSENSSAISKPAKFSTDEGWGGIEVLEQVDRGSTVSVSGGSVGRKNIGSSLATSHSILRTLSGQQVLSSSD